MRQLLILAIILSAVNVLLASPDPNQLVQLQTLAESAAKNNQPDSALLFLEKAAHHLKTKDDLIQWIKAHKSIGRIFRDEHGEPAFAISVFKKAAEPWRQPNTDEEWEELAWLYVNIGYTYNYRLSQPQPAVQYYELGNDIMSNRLQVEDAYVAEYILQVLGNLNTKLGDFAAAEVYLEQFKKVCLGIGANNLAAEAFSDLSILYKTTRRYEASVASYKQGLELPNLSHISKGLLEGNLAETLADSMAYEEALVYSQKAISSFKKSKEEYNYQNADSYIANLLDLEGMVLTETGAYDQAALKFAEALTLFQQMGTALINRDAGKLHVSWGKLFLRQGKSEQALEHFQKALHEVIPDFDAPTPHTNPTIHQIYQENTIIDALDGKILAFSQAFSKSKDPKVLEKALACHDLINEMGKQFRQSYHYESSKLFSLEESRATSEHALIVAIQLWNATNNPIYKAKAFEIAEKNKSILLLEAFQKSKAEAIAGVPQKILEQEKSIQKAIAEKEKALFNGKANGLEDSTLQSLQLELLALQQDYSQWQGQIEKEYPNYFNLKYKFEPAALKDIQKNLGKKEALLEYFVGQNQIYAFVVTAKNLEILQLSKDFPLEEWVIQFRKDIEAFQFPNSDRTVLCASYTQLALQLYQKLFAPIETRYQLPEKLTIIPSGILGYLPFDALLKAQPGQQCQFEKYPYLLYDYHINYGYSATLQATLHQTKGNNTRFAGFAPEFSSESRYGALEQNIPSLKTIGTLMGGELFLGQAASLDHFLAQAGQFGILQLATHAKANTEAGDFSYVIFSDGKNGYDSLFVRDIYLLELAAELVVLSACETAVGTVYSSEGIISLARSFLYSGAKSIITTLWSINENTNLKIVENFYAELKKGQAKSSALRLAKIQQIEESDRFHAHPVYWAALAPIGDSGQIFRAKKWWVYGAGAFLFLLIGGFFIWFQKRPHLGLTPNAV